MRDIVQWAGVACLLCSPIIFASQTLQPDGYENHGVSNQAVQDGWAMGQDRRTNTYNPTVDPTLKVRDAWAAPTIPGQKNELVYLSIQTPVMAQLDSIYCPLAKEVRLFDSNPNALSFKDRFSSIQFPVTLMPRMVYKFSPNGKKLVLMGLKGPLKVGDQIPLTFQLNSALYNNTTSAALSVLITVRNPPSAKVPAQTNSASPSTGAYPQQQPNVAPQGAYPASSQQLPNSGANAP